MIYTSHQKTLQECLKVRTQIRARTSIIYRGKDLFIDLFREIFIEPEYDIIFIEGNKKYLKEEDHKNLREKVLQGFENKKTLILQSTDKNLNIPTAKVYIGFSRGTSYFSKLQSRDGFKLSIGGSSGKYALLLKNPKDKTSKWDNSEESMNAHFTITTKMKNTIDRYLNKYLNKKEHNGK